MQYQTQPQCALLYTTHFSECSRSFWYSMHTNSLHAQCTYCRNNTSSMLVCYSKHSHCVLCCILRILANVAGHLGVSCIKKIDNKHTAEVLVCYFSCAPFYFTHFDECCRLFGIPCIQPLFMHSIHTAKIIRVMLVCDSEHIYSVLYCILYKYLANTSFYSMHTKSLHAQNIYTAYYNNNKSSRPVLVCNSKHIYNVLCCILNKYLTNTHSGISCIQNPFMHNIVYILQKQCEQYVSMVH